MYTVIHSQAQLYDVINTMIQHTCIHVYNYTRTQRHMYTTTHVHTTTHDQPIDRETHRQTEEQQNSKKNKHLFNC